MSEPLSPERHQAAQVTRTQPESESPPPPHASYTYQSAGITEREGHVPRWLWVVAAGLIVWGVYYLIRYWQPPT